MFSVESYAFQGPAFYDGVKYEKLDREDAEDRALARDIQGGWIAGMQHHFVTAIVPAGSASYRYTLKTDGNQYLLSTTGPSVTVAPGSGATLSLHAQDRRQSISTLDYGSFGDRCAG